MKHSKTVFLILLTAVLTVPAASELQNLDGSVWVNEDYNWTLTFQTSNLSASNITIQDDTLRLDQDNISISSTSNEQVNATLYTYDLSSSPSLGNEVLRLETEGSGTVDYELTGIPSISSEHYVLRVDDSKLGTFTSGSKISWSHDDWGSKHNFTLIYEEKPEEDDGDDGGGGIDLGSDGYTGSEVSSRTWFTGGNTFRFDNIDTVNGIDNITVQTESNQSQFEITVKQVENTSNAPEIEDSYRIYEINVSEGEIESSTIEFSVNQSFVKQYDKTVLARYENNWTGLPTRQIGTKNQKLVYQASTTGYSYFAVKGVTQEEDTEEPQDNQTNTPESEENTTSGENQSKRQAESAVQEAEQKIQKNQPGYELLQQAESALESGRYGEAQRLAENALNRSEHRTKNRHDKSYWVFLPVAIILALFIYLGYGKWKERKLRELAKELRKKVEEKENSQLDDTAEIIHLLNEAETANQSRHYRKAEKHLKEAEEILED